jgi:hypothetical protein
VFDFEVLKLKLKQAIAKAMSGKKNTDDNGKEETKIQNVEDK